MARADRLTNEKHAGVIAWLCDWVKPWCSFWEEGAARKRASRRTVCAWIYGRGRDATAVWRSVRMLVARKGDRGIFFEFASLHGGLFYADRHSQYVQSWQVVLPCSREENHVVLASPRKVLRVEGGKAECALGSCLDTGRVTSTDGCCSSAPQNRDPVLLAAAGTFFHRKRVVGGDLVAPCERGILPRLM